jgi:RNA polymerase sigma factor (sigma-70 family)
MTSGPAHEIDTGGVWVARLRAAQGSGVQGSGGQGGGGPDDGRHAASAAALTDLLSALGELLVRYGERRLRRFPDAHDAAHDVAQETLLRVARGAGACAATTDARFLAWVLAIARHVLADEIRSPGRRLHVRPAAADLLGADARLATDAWARGPAERPPRRLARIVRAAYDALPPTTAELLWMRVEGGASWPEVAAAFGTTPAGAKRRFQCAQRRLRRAVLLRAATLSAQERVTLLGEPRGSGARRPATD